MDKINAKVSKLSTETLQDMARRLFADQRDGAEVVLSAVLDALCARLPEQRFVDFCDGIQ